MRQLKPSDPVACDATARGIVQCLRMLAEEASSLHLPSTVRALWSAIGTCEHESSTVPVLPPGEPVQQSIASLN